MKTYTLKELAAHFDVNRVTAYRWVKQHKQQLGNSLQQNKKGLYLTEQGREILRQLIAHPDEVEATKQHKRNGSATEQQQCNSDVTAEISLLVEYRDRIKQQDATIMQLHQDLRNISQSQAEERHRTDTILMKMTSDISNMQKALEYKKQDELDVSSIIKAKHEEEQKAAEELSSLAKTTDSKIEQLSQLLIQQQNDFKMFKSSLESKNIPWYMKLWNWMNQPVTWRGKDFEIQMELSPESRKDKPRTGLVRISDVKAA